MGVNWAHTNGLWNGGRKTTAGRRQGLAIRLRYCDENGRCLMSLGKAFLSAAVLAFIVASGAIVIANWSAPLVASDDAAARPLLQHVVVREQVGLVEIPAIRSEGIKTIVDLRPDGEAPDQPSAAIIGEAVRAAGMNFVYVPTPHGDIPDAAVDGLARALATAERLCSIAARANVPPVPGRWPKRRARMVQARLRLLRRCAVPARRSMTSSR